MQLITIKKQTRGVRYDRGMRLDIKVTFHKWGASYYTNTYNNATEIVRLQIGRKPIIHYCRLFNIYWAIA